MNPPSWASAWDVVLSRAAKSVIDACRGEDDKFVFTTETRDGRRHPQARMNNSGWNDLPPSLVPGLSS